MRRWAFAPNGNLALSVWAIVAAFGTYFCMYAFRKPFTAATYEGVAVAGLSFKVLLVTSQVIGYTVSKFIGIRVIAEMPPARRCFLIIALIAMAHGALLLFGLTPAPYNCIWLFFNGLPLGMVFGLVLGFLEGRRQSEALAAGLCASFIVADGVVKSAGARVMEAGVGAFWMPFITGALFAPALLLFVWMLSRLPPPSQEDLAARSARPPMSGEERRRFLRAYGPGLALISLAYLLVTVLRSLRADFAPEIWSGLQTKVSPDVFGWSETAVGAVVLVSFGMLVLIRDNRRGFGAGMGVAIGGALLIPAAMGGLYAGILSPFGFMVTHGLGLYLPYIAVHTVVFERLIAMTRDRGNVGYLLYLADAFGYLGYVFVLLARNLSGPPGQFLPFFTGMSWVIAFGVVLFLVPAWRFFAAHPTVLSSPDAACLVETPPLPATR